MQEFDRTIHENLTETQRDIISGKTARRLKEKMKDNRVQRERQGYTLVREIPKIGRNELCPCGSGKKFKKCCLELAR